MALVQAGQRRGGRGVGPRLISSITTTVARSKCRVLCEPSSARMNIAHSRPSSWSCSLKGRSMEESCERVAHREQYTWPLEARTPRGGGRIFSRARGNEPHLGGEDIEVSDEGSTAEREGCCSVASQRRDGARQARARPDGERRRRGGGGGSRGGTRARGRGSGRARGRQGRPDPHTGSRHDFLRKLLQPLHRFW